MLTPEAIVARFTEYVRAEIAERRRAFATHLVRDGLSDDAVVEALVAFNAQSDRVTQSAAGQVRGMLERNGIAGAATLSLPSATPPVEVIH